MYRLGIFSDLHTGHSGSGSWHNRLLYDHAEEIARSTVAFLNNQSLDTVLILGDVSNDGEKKQLELARSILNELNMIWLIIPGNHDRAGIRSGDFFEVFAGHVPDLIGEMAGIPSVFLSELLPGDEYPKTELGEVFIEKAVDEIKRTGADDLFIFSHFPLRPQDDFARRQNAKYAKQFLDGNTFLDRIRQLVSGRIVCFAGHQHWHRIVNEDRITHCTSASLIEYPMEARMVTIGDGKIGFSTFASACPKIAESSLDSNAWVSGTGRDRNIEIVLGK